MYTIGTFLWTGLPFNNVISYIILTLDSNYINRKISNKILNKLLFKDP